MTELHTDNEAMDCAPEIAEGVRWSEYAARYDEFVVPLTCYQDNINQLIEFLKSANLPATADICDLGAGTGIYIEALSKVMPDAKFLHVDSNEEMCKYAGQRYLKNGLQVEILNESAKHTGIREEALDLVTSVNVIYALPDPIGTLQDIYRWLKPGGYFFTIDFGRRQNSLDWTQYFFRELYKRKGFVDTAKAIPSAINLFQRQNEGVAAQDTGAYWLHSTEEFQEALQNVGFSVEKALACYRGYADLAVCRKPA